MKFINDKIEIDDIIITKEEIPYMSLKELKMLGAFIDDIELLEEIAKISRKSEYIQYIDNLKSKF